MAKKHLRDLLAGLPLGLRGRIALTYMMVILLVAITMGLFVVQRVERYYYDDMQIILAARGRIVASLFERYLINDIDLSATAPDLAREFARDVNAQVEILDDRGRIIGNSQGSIGGELRSAPVQRALAGQIGSALLNGGNGHRRIEVAVPIRLERLVGVLVLISSDREVRATVTVLWRFILLGTLLALAVVGLVSLWLGETLSEPVLELTGLAEAMAAGNFAVRAREGRRDELGGLAASLNRMAGELGRLEKIRAEFLAKVSHELRTPLTIIKGYVAAVQDEIPAGDSKQSDLAVIEREADRMIDMVDDLLQAARSHASRLEIEPVPTDLGAVLDDAVASMRVGKADGAGVRLRWEKRGTVMVRGDRSRLRQVFLNLLDNAIKHSHPGAEVIVRLRSGRNLAKVEIRDFGPGIPPEEVGRIFEPYFRGAGQEVPGTGLGLTIIREIVEAHGGHLTVRSRGGGGTAVIVSLPVYSAKP